MTAKSHAFETRVFNNIPLHLNPSMEGNDSKKSDISISYNGNITYVEVKMDTKAQFGTPRMKYEKGKWSGVSDNPICNFVADKINTSSHAKEIVNHLETIEDKEDSWIGYNMSHYKNFMNQVEIPSRNINLMISYESIQKQMNAMGNQYVYPKEISDSILPSLLNYYIKKGALFSQIGNNFYKLADIDCNLYGIKNEVPLLKADAAFDVRFTFRKSNKWIETIPTIKLLNVVESKYSILGKESPLME